MKSLYVLRHANAQPTKFGGQDIERSLSSNGQRDAGMMGVYMAANGVVPQLVLCSAARRAQETLSGLALDLPTDVRIEIDEALYLAESARLIETIAMVEASISSILLIGHNPGIEHLINNLKGGGVLGGVEAGALNIFSADWPDWDKISSDRMTLDRTISPRDLATSSQGSADG